MHGHGLTHSREWQFLTSSLLDSLFQPTEHPVYKLISFIIKCGPLTNNILCMFLCHLPESEHWPQFGVRPHSSLWLPGNGKALKLVGRELHCIPCLPQCVYIARANAWIQIVHKQQNIISHHFGSQEGQDQDAIDPEYSKGSFGVHSGSCCGCHMAKETRSPLLLQSLTEGLPARLNHIGG